ncbi:RBBP9/YdeN family alpha/beta hydrolase [Pedobacter caeni]|uniref:Alpha/beta hydrolase n=1 Tax=Pedobacter caeni TaxID=288992 RepID=A0A1M4WEX0_9SPHI|nr:alpha/beta hydrolase [Pedobacter caeni]SHE79502.1 hypothetical protein SAMN04488522_1011238 [Pedobacter caeni]
MGTKILIMPGLGGSGERHWQSFWLKEFDNAVWLEQDNWEEPELEKWLEKLNESLSVLNGPVILVAHSLAVSLVAHWAVKHSAIHIKGALLVAPADVDSPTHTPDIIRNFAPIPLSKLPFPSIVVASRNDPYIDLQRAMYFAEQWGSEFIDVGSKGHINSETDLGLWEEGQLLLQRLNK